MTPASPPRVTRWGLRLLGFLGVAFVAAVAASAQGAYTVVTGPAVLVGLSGASVCTVAGLRSLYRTPPDQRTQGHERS